MCIYCKDTDSQEVRQTRHCTYKSLQKSHIDRANYTLRENMVLMLQCQGLTIVQIAEKLNISQKTVYVHLRSVKIKLKAKEAQP